MALTVEVTPRALRDIDREVGWFARHRSAKYADGWHVGIEARMERLADTATSQPEAEEAAELGFPLREAVFARGRTTFRILFVITGDVVRVLRVRNAAQDRLTDADL